MLKREGSTLESADGSRSDFRRRVVAAVRRIPVGRVATYGDIAALAGRPRAWRAVGTIMRTCTDRGVPCHRVIAAGGRLGGYGGSEALKRALLQAEGIIVVNGGVRRFRDVRFAGAKPASPKPRSKTNTRGGGGPASPKPLSKTNTRGGGGQRR
jgi:methylated-DNA-[protein]-cysteine S-methyltransferase